MSVLARPETEHRARRLLEATLVSAEGKQNPYQHFAELHELGECFRMPDGSHIAVSYAAASEVLRSRKFVKGDEKFFLPPQTVTTEEQMQELLDISSDASPLLVQIDPPDHTRIRNLVQRSFTPRHVAALDQAISLEIHRLLDALDPRQPTDIIANFSAILAPNIMANLIGLPVGQRKAVSALTAEMMRGVDPGASFDVRRHSALAFRTQRDIVRAVIADRRAQPSDDLVGTLAAIDTRELTDKELVSLLQILYIGGYETTAHMIGNGLVALLTHPEQFALLLERPSLVGSAVDEMLRFDGAIALVKMFAGEGATLRGAPAEVGAPYIALLAAANRDPKAFPDPNRFDITRAGPQHLAFSGGAHYCLGANLARSELERAFTALLERFPRMQLVGGIPNRTPNFHQRSFERVVLQLEPTGKTH
jgi:cytochrome P450